jgi:hypothetical protein
VSKIPHSMLESSVSYQEFYLGWSSGVSYFQSLDEQNAKGIRSIRS